MCARVPDLYSIVEQAPRVPSPLQSTHGCVGIDALPPVTVTAPLVKNLAAVNSGRPAASTYPFSVRLAMVSACWLVGRPVRPYTAQPALDAAFTTATIPGTAGIRWPAIQTACLAGS